MARAVVALALALVSVAAQAQDDEGFFTSSEAFDAAKQEAARSGARPVTSTDSSDVLSGLAPSGPDEYAGDSAGAAAAGALMREQCERNPESPECAAAATFSVPEPWLRQYPLGFDDGIFRGAARGEISVGLGLDVPPTESCQTLTLSADASEGEEFSCYSREYSDIPENPVVFAGQDGGPLGASFARSAGGVHSIDVSSNGWITKYLYGVHDFAFTLSVADPGLLREAKLVRIRYDDWASVALNGSVLFVGPGGGDRLEIDAGLRICTGPGTCSSLWDLGAGAVRWHALDIDIAPLLVAGDNVISVRLVHGGRGGLDLQGRVVESAEARDGARWRDFLDEHPDAAPCSELDGRACHQRARGECLLESVAGGCAQWEYRYSCAPSGGRTVVVCDAANQMYCADGSCFDKESEPTPADEFARSVAFLEMARQAGSYLDPDSLRIFSGVAAHCRERAFGLADCCDSAGGNANLSNASLLAALAGEAAGGAIRFAGSPHVYDALYVADSPRLLSGLLPGSGLDYAPGLSFYGIQASYTGAGGLVVSFDPASFAVAVALAIASSLLECDRQEQILALRKGKGLCVATGTFCSRSTFAGCATEKTGHCCYNSKLARIVADAGREQIGRDWGSPARPECEGFTAEELKQVDFTLVDLSSAFSDISPAHTAELVERFKDSAEAFVAESASGEEDK